MMSADDKSNPALMKPDTSKPEPSIVDEKLASQVDKLIEKTEGSNVATVGVSTTKNPYLPPDLG